MLTCICTSENPPQPDRSMAHTVHTHMHLHTHVYTYATSYVSLYVVQGLGSKVSP